MNAEQLKQAAAVMLAAAEGKPIEWRDNGSERWRVVPVPSFDWIDFDYRIAVTKPSINWDHVHPDYKWMATDQNGKASLYTSKPYIDDEYWLSDFYTPAANFASFVPGTCDWKDSLVVRPGVE